MGIETSGYNLWFCGKQEGNFKDYFSLIWDVEGNGALYNLLFFEAAISEIFFSFKLDNLEMNAPKGILKIKEKVCWLKIDFVTSTF